MCNYSLAIYRCRTNIVVLLKSNLNLSHIVCAVRFSPQRQCRAQHTLLAKLFQSIGEKQMPYLADATRTNPSLFIHAGGTRQAALHVSTLDSNIWMH